MLGSKLAALRKSKGLSQYELADRLGFSRGKLSNYEQGTRQPDYDTLKKIASFFDVSIDYLLDLSDESSQARETKIKLIDQIVVDEDINIAFFGGRKEDLSEEEAAHLEESLEMFRLLKAKRMAERKTRNDTNI